MAGNVTIIDGSHAPFILQAAGDNYNKGCRILSIVWTGVTVSGDQCILEDSVTHEVIWQASTGSTVTYKGIVYPFPHVGCNGFRLRTTLPTSVLLVQVAQVT